MPGQMILKIWDVQNGACAMLTRRDGWIQFNVNDLSGFDIYTECYG